MNSPNANAGWYTPWGGLPKGKQVRLTVLYPILTEVGTLRGVTYLR